MSTTIKPLPPMEKICSNDDLRFTLSLILIKDGCAIATDAHILVKYNLRNYIGEDILKALDGKQIHKATWVLIKKNYHSFRIIDNEVVLIHNDYGVIKIKTFTEKYPNVDTIFKECTNSLSVTATTSIGINANILQIISKVLCHDSSSKGNVNVRFNGEGKGMFVISETNAEAIGIIMPVMTNNDSFEQMIKNFNLNN